MKEHHKEALIRFGQRLAKLRKERGLSQEGLALKSGISRSYLGGVERGQRNISLVTIQRLAKTLEITLSHLMDYRTTDAEAKATRPPDTSG